MDLFIEQSIVSQYVQDIQANQNEKWKRCCGLSSIRETLYLCCFHVGPASPTMGHHVNICRSDVSHFEGYE